MSGKPMMDGELHRNLEYLVQTFMKLKNQKMPNMRMLFLNENSTAHQ